MKSWFRMIAAAFKSPAPATAVAGLSTFLLVLYTGYSLPQPYMIGALKWITWINVGLHTVHGNQMPFTNSLA